MTERHESTRAARTLWGRLARIVSGSYHAGNVTPDSQSSSGPLAGDAEM